MFESLFKKITSKSGKLENTVQPRTEDPLEAGRYVTVRRSSGDLESGFKIIFFDKKKGVFVVEKSIGGGKVAGKEVPLKELEELNPPR